MDKSEGLLAKLTDGFSVSRRGFVKAASAFGAAATLYGCSKDDGGDVIYGGGVSQEPDPIAPAITEEVFYGSTPHNCGGYTCVLKAYVKNGVIKRITTDEELSDDSYLTFSKKDEAQARACGKCRSRKSMIYDSNRLCYPLIQTGERGDLSSFKRVSWKEAAMYIKAKSEKIVNRWGYGTFYNLYASGSGGAEMIYGIGGGSNVVSAFGTYHDYSWPAWEHVVPIIDSGTLAGYGESNTYADAFNADELVVWGHNFTETQWFYQPSWYFKQIHESGVRVTVIDGRYTQTAAAACDDFVNVINGTDSALIAGMVHAILKDYLEDFKTMYKNVTGATINNNDDLRRAVGRYLFGFFDTEDTDPDTINKSTKLTGVDKTNFDAVCKVGAGASWSAYIFGNSDYLVGLGLNKGKSIYPDNIGYNVRGYQVPNPVTGVMEDDPLKGKSTKCYGQVEKTPEWAEKVTGVPADKIRALAKMFLTKNVTIWTGSGFQRCNESEEMVKSWLCFTTLVLAFGKPGRSHGAVTDKATPPANPQKSGTWRNGAVYPLPTQSNWLTVNGGYMKDYNTLDPSEWTTGPRKDENFLTTAQAGAGNGIIIGPYGEATLNAMPVFTWLEYVESTLNYFKPANNVRPNVTKRTYNTGTAKFEDIQKPVTPARWNTGTAQTAGAPVKWLNQVAGNILVVQCADTNMRTAIFGRKDSSLIDSSAVPGVTGVQMNPKGYEIEFITVCDNVMTPSARWADLILPGSMGFERWANPMGWGTRSAIFTGKAINPPGDALPEIEIGAHIADAWGQKDGYYNNLKPTKAMTFEELYWREKVDGIDVNGELNVPWTKLAKGYRMANTDQDVRAANMDPAAIARADYMRDPIANPLNTTTGKVCAYSLAYMENYEARFFNNVDKSITLPNNGKLYTKSTAGVNKADGVDDTAYGRYVYPVPMYIPLLEGRHACDTSTGTSNDATLPKHPDPLGCSAGGMTLTLHTWHIFYRSHSSFNPSPLLNELKYYKRDAQGKASYLNRAVTNKDAEANGTKAAQSWHDGVYECVWINPADAAAKSIREGDVIIVESLRGKVAASAHLTERAPQGSVFVGQGSWYNPIENWVGPSGKKYDKVDVGTCANTLTSLRPSRMCQGMTLANAFRVNVYKA